MLKLKFKNRMVYAEVNANCDDAVDAFIEYAYYEGVDDDLHGVDDLDDVELDQLNNECSAEIQGYWHESMIDRACDAADLADDR